MFVRRVGGCISLRYKISERTQGVHLQFSHNNTQMTDDDRFFPFLLNYKAGFIICQGNIKKLLFFVIQAEINKI